MSRKDYIMLSEIIGDALAIALIHGGESARTEAYNECYRPLVSALQNDNHAFDEHKFAFAVSARENHYLNLARNTTS